MRHEQCAAHAAQGYARATGRPGVCLATSGPGATNLITGLADAMLDSTPVVALTAQVATPLLGRDGFQEADILGMTAPVTKHNWLVLDPQELPGDRARGLPPRVLGPAGPRPRGRAARRSAGRRSSGRTGIVTASIPPRRADPVDLRRAAFAISNAKRPILYVGGGVISSGASAEVRRLAKKTRIPVTTTLMGKGAYPETDALSVGMLGMHGTAYANWAMNGSDLIIAVGARFDDRITGKLATFAPHAKVVHVDIDEVEIGKNRKADLPAPRRRARRAARSSCPSWALPTRRTGGEQIEAWKAKAPLRYRQEGDVILPQFAIESLWRLTRDLRPIVTTDVGQHQMWAAQFWKSDEPGTFITSGGLGTMGFGLPAALGAQCGRPDRLVINLNGDGSFQQTMQTLATAVEARLPLKVDRPRQPGPRHGAAVAGSLLRPPLLLGGAPEPRLREAGRSVRRRGLHGAAAGRAGRRLPSRRSP